MNRVVDLVRRNRLATIALVAALAVAYVLEFGWPL